MREMNVRRSYYLFGKSMTCLCHDIHNSNSKNIIESTLKWQRMSIFAFESNTMQTEHHQQPECYRRMWNGMRSLNSKPTLTPFLLWMLLVLHLFIWMLFVHSILSTVFLWIELRKAKNRQRERKREKKNYTTVTHKTKLSPPTLALSLLQWKYKFCLKWLPMLVSAI